MVVIAHEWLTSYGGAERVLESMIGMWPGADVVCAYGTRRGMRGSEIAYSPLNRLYRSGIDFSWYRIASPLAFAMTRAHADDLLVSNGHSGTLWLRSRGGAPWLHYCNTPSRFIWHPELLRVSGGRLPLRYRMAAALYRQADRRRARLPDVVLANSRAVRDRIRECYGRDAEIVHPPVDTDYFTYKADVERLDRFVVVSRLEAHKQIHVVIEAFRRLPWRLVLVGDGRGLGMLRRLAQGMPNVSFRGPVDDRELRDLYRSSLAVIVPGEEDFCMVAVEAMACGTPVIGRKVGGVSESVVDGATGLLIDRLNPCEIARACGDSVTLSWDRPALQAHATKFSKRRFERRLGDAARVHGWA